MSLLQSNVYLFLIVSRDSRIFSQYFFLFFKKKKKEKGTFQFPFQIFITINFAFSSNLLDCFRLQFFENKHCIIIMSQRTVHRIWLYDVTVIQECCLLLFSVKVKKECFIYSMMSLLITARFYFSIPPENSRKPLGGIEK